MAESPAKTSSANLSDLVKEMVKEMDANDFYSRGDMYDESAEEPWFTIDICLKRGDGEPASPGASLRKPWSEFQRLHYLLVTDEFGCDGAVKTQLPNLPPGPVPLVSGERSSSGGGGGCGGVTDSGSSADIAQGLDAYLKALLDVPAVVQSQVFSGFLEKNSGRRPEKEEEEKQGAGARSAPELGSSDRGGDGSGYGGEGAPRSPETAIDFLLQPFDYGRAYVPRRAEHTERIDVLRGESVVWKFEVMDHLDIEFSVVFRPHPIAVPSWVPGDDINGQATDPGGVVSSPGPRGFGRGGAVMAKESNGCGKGASAASGSGQRQRSGWWRSGSGGAGGSGDGGGVGSENKAAGKVEEAEEGDGTVNDQTVHLPTRYSTGGGDPVQGSFTCSADGM